jgi:subtilisin family serine protease
MTSPRFALAAGMFAVACAAGAATAPAKVYIVQLADAPAATYTGNITGLPATRPVAGARLDARSPAVRAYLRYLEAQHNNSIAAAGKPRVIHRYSITFNGYSALMTASQAKSLMSTAGVKSVSPSEIRKLDTTSTPDFLGLTGPNGLWSRVQSSSRFVKGEDVIIGVLDGGVWPENASFSDKVDASGRPVAYHLPGTQVYGAPPAKWNGTCQVSKVAGDASFSTAMCNNKLLGARYYADSFKASGAVMASFEWDSPRDGDGHGTHTASTAGGNENAQATIDGVAVGAMSGIAPRARLSTYKVCWNATVAASTGCYTADTLKAIDDAVADGVDVINYSVSGTKTNFLDAVEISYLNAVTAGVFVASSAGNSGPGNEVAHISPWMMTVAASTHDRPAFADLNLGNGQSFTGVSVFTGNLPSAPIILSSTIPAAGQSVSNANLCLLNSLSATAAIGKIVVCDRGNNARVEKSAEVKRVGGVGMVQINPSPNSQVADFHSIPSIHFDSNVRTAIRNYAATAGATATFSPPAVPPAVVAPVMAGFSSRGPNKANGNILKPDITGPGVDIIAAYVDRTMTAAQHAAVVAGTLVPNQNANSISGTSMSSPHVAGAAALLRQLYPSWSPAAIKSAMMTSTNDVMLANGTPDADRWGYGAGHMNPNGSANPGLVYDITPADYARFLCGVNLTPPAALGTCATLGSTTPSNLNLASITAADVTGSTTLTRTVKNVTGAAAFFTANATLPGWTVQVTPSQLNLAAGASGTFNIKLTNTAGTTGVWSFGSLNWTDGVVTVRSPLSARGLGFAAPAQISDVRTSGKGSKVFTIVSAYTGSLQVVPNGLVASTRSTGFVLKNARQCFNTVVPAGAEQVRFQLFNADTDGAGSTDLDLDVFNGANGVGTNVGSSGGGESEETVTLKAPAAGTYSACVTGFNTPAAGANFTLSSWTVGPTVGTTLKASGPASVYVGGTASIGLNWDVPAGQRYLGTVTYKNGAEVLGATTVFIDNK